MNAVSTARHKLAASINVSRAAARVVADAQAISTRAAAALEKANENAAQWPDLDQQIADHHHGLVRAALLAGVAVPTEMPLPTPLKQALADRKAAKDRLVPVMAAEAAFDAELDQARLSQRGADERTSAARIQLIGAVTEALVDDLLADEQRVAAKRGHLHAIVGLRSLRMGHHQSPRVMRVLEQPPANAEPAEALIAGVVGASRAYVRPKLSGEIPPTVADHQALVLAEVASKTNFQKALEAPCVAYADALMTDPNATPPWSTAADEALIASASQIGQADDDKLLELQDEAIASPATTLAGLVATAELLTETRRRFQPDAIDPEDRLIASLLVGLRALGAPPASAAAISAAA